MSLLLADQDLRAVIWRLILGRARWPWWPRDYQFFLLSLSLWADTWLVAITENADVSSVRIHLLQGVGNFILLVKGQKKST